MAQHPTHIIIDKASRHLIQKRVVDALSHKSIAHLISKIHEPSVGRIDLSKFASNDEEVRRVFRALVRRGIDHRHIEIMYAGLSPKRIAHRTFEKGICNLNLDLGSSVAEKEDDLGSYFIKTPIYDRAESNKAHIIIGPKGAGKSAILRILHENRENNSVVITPEHYSTDVLEALNNKATDIANAYVSTWKYSLLTEIFRTLVNARRDKPTKNIRKLLRNNGHLDPKETIFDRFVNYLKRFSAISGSFGGAELSIDIENPGQEDIEELFKMTELFEVIPELRSLLKNDPFYVFIDELDQSWDNKETSNNFLIALFSAALQLRGIDQNLHIMIFLRSEIFDLLKPQMAQIDKMRTDICVVNWSRRELQNLIAERIKLSLQELTNLPAETIVREMFGGRMPGTSIEVFDYLLSRTSMRPREVIQLCSLALEHATRLEDFALSERAIRNAEEEFSVWKFEHFCAENMYSFPNIEEAIELLRGRGPVISKLEFEDISSDFIIQGLDDELVESWQLKLDFPQDVIELLFRIGVVGVERQVEVEPDDGNEVWERYDFSHNRPKARVNRSDSFIIHPSLWRYLEVPSH